MTSKTVAVLGFAGVLLALGAAACSQQQAATPPRIDEKSFAVKPAAADLRVGFLAGQLTDLKVVERVNQETGEVVQLPRLQGTLKLTNPTPDQTARLIGGSLEFIDRDGKPITVAKDREAPRFTFLAYSTDRLDPGMETSHNIDVSFPAAAVNGQRLSDIRVNLTYIPDPYRADTATVAVTLAQ